MTKNILELGIYIAIMSLLLGIVALVNVLLTDVDRKESNSNQNISESVYLQN